MKNTYLLLLVAVAAGAAGLWLASSRDAASIDTESKVALLLPEPKVISDFALIDANEQPFGINQFKGAWDLIFFGFTHCPDICPTSLAVMAQVRSQLVQSGMAEKDLPRLNFISVDPMRDTPANIGTYAAHFDSSMRAITGPSEQLGALSMQLGVVYYIADDATVDAGYNVDHSAAIIIIDPMGRYAGIFPAPHDPMAIAMDYPRLLK